MQNSWLIILVVLAAVIIASLAFYAGKLLLLLQQQTKHHAQLAAKQQQQNKRPPRALNRDLCKATYITKIQSQMCSKQKKTKPASPHGDPQARFVENQGNNDSNAVGHGTTYI